MKLTLRDYQKKAIDKVLNNLDKKKILINATMGSGKSVIASYIAKELHKNQQVVISTDISTLVPQLENHLMSLSIEPTVVIGGKVSKGKDNVIVALEQSLVNRTELLDDNYMLVLDEIQRRFNGDRLQSIIKDKEPTNIIGMTGTPYDSNGIKMKDWFYINALTISEAIDKGYLVPNKYFIPKIVTKLDFDSIDKGVADYSAEDIRKLYSDKEFQDWFCNFIKQLNLKDRHTLVYVSNIKMAEEYASLIKKIEPTTEVVHSQNDNDIAIEHFKQGKCKVLVSISKLAIGFDATIADTLINLRPTKSYNLMHQMFFRCCRLHPSKNHADVYDITDCLIRMGIPEDFKPFKDKTEFKKHKLQQTIVEQLINRTNEKMLEITKEKIEDFELYLEELENNSYHLLTIDELRDLFNATSNIRTLVLVANEYHRRKYGWQLRTKTIELIIKNMEDVLDKLSEYNKEASTIKAYKTRIRNLLNSGKKLASMIHFPGWFYEQTINKYRFVDKW